MCPVQAAAILGVLRSEAQRDHGELELLEVDGASAVRVEELKDLSNLRNYRSRTHDPSAQAWRGLKDNVPPKQEASRI